MEKQQNKAEIATKEKVLIAKKVANVLILTGCNLAYFDAIDLLYANVVKLVKIFGTEKILGYDTRCSFYFYVREKSSPEDSLNYVRGFVKLLSFNQRIYYVFTT